MLSASSSLKRTSFMRLFFRSLKTTAATPTARESSIACKSKETFICTF